MNALPIQLASFTGNVQGNGSIQLTWVTLSEVNNYGFYVQRKREDDQEYTEFPNSFIPGHGTTNEPQYYTYIDSTVTGGVWYYRLKQVDLNGTVHFSDGIRISTLTGAKEAEIPKAFSLSQNFPNPFNPSTLIRYTLPRSSAVTLAIYNALGQQVAQLVSQHEEAGYYDVELRADRLASGVYFYRLQAGGFTSVKRLLVIN